jgi:hypothetical protein
MKPLWLRKAYIMNLKKLVAITALAAATVAPMRAAAAQYVKVDYSGTVTSVFSGAPSWLTPGLSVSFEGIFNPADLVDHTATADAILSAFGLDPSAIPTSVFNASLSDDPNASLTIKIGPETFSKFNELQYGTPDGDTPFNLGTGNLPAADYINGSFAGLSNTFLAPDGVGLNADPFNNLFGGFDGHEIGIGLATLDDSNPLDNIVAEGDVDLSTVTFTPVSISAVPEPKSWALMIVGAGLAGFALRGRTGLDRRRSLAR